MPVRSGQLSILLAFVAVIGVAVAGRFMDASDQPLVGALAGLVLFYVALTAINLASAARKLRIKRTRPSNAPFPIHLPAATIADDLIPIMTPHVGAGAVVRVLGFDSHYTCSRNGPVFTAGLEDWLKSGATIEYLLLSEALSDDVRAALRKLQAAYDGKFKPRVLRAAATGADPAAQELAETYRTFHPTLLESGDKRAMWVESLHDANSVFAYGVKFVSPAAMSDAELISYTRYRSDFEALSALSQPLAA